MKSCDELLGTQGTILGSLGSKESTSLYKFLSTGSLYNQCFVRFLPHSITFSYIPLYYKCLPMHSIVFYKILLIIKRMTMTTVAYSKLSINM
jgi:hypothetical protein